MKAVDVCVIWMAALHWRVMIRVGLGVVLIALMAGCNCSGPAARTESEAAMFAPVSMRIHPIFSSIKDFDGDGIPDGIEALIEFQDQFGDPTKACGTVIFELFGQRKYYPDPRADRLCNPWIGSLRTLQNQKERWNSTSRTYQFQLAYPQIRLDRNYVLAATFDTGTTRFFDRIVFEGTPKTKGPTSKPTTEPTTEPTTQPDQATTEPAATSEPAPASDSTGITPSSTQGTAAQGAALKGAAGATSQP